VITASDLSILSKKSLKSVWRKSRSRSLEKYPHFNSVKGSKIHAIEDRDPISRPITVRLRKMLPANEKDQVIDS